VHGVAPFTFTYTTAVKGIDAGAVAGYRNRIQQACHNHSEGRTVHVYPIINRCKSRNMLLWKASCVTRVQYDFVMQQMELAVDTL
jgi:hypothetical protein